MLTPTAPPSSPHQSISSLIDLLCSLSDDEREAAITELRASLTESQANEILWNWRSWARPKQLRPGTPGAESSREDWVYWLIQAGRGFGKTRTGAETVRQWIYEGVKQIALIGATLDDCRKVMVEHPDGGLLSCFPPHERGQIIYQPSLKRIEFWTGAVVGMFSAEEPERLRGPKHEKVWGDEVAAWKYGPECMDQIAFGLRIGDRPQMICTTTPKPVKVIRDLVKDKHTVVTLGGSYENRDNLSKTFFDTIVKKYEGTRLGDQELRGMLLEDLPGALWKRSMIDSARVALVQVPQLARVVVAIDPAVTATEDSDETGIGAVGLSFDGHLFVLEDASLRASPLEWARAACALLSRWKGDRVVAEVNNGGDLVEGNLRAYNPNVPFRAVHATRGKLVRAEPVAALYEQGRVHHVGSDLSALEDQLCSWVPNSGMKSPDRMDWLCWAITDLLVNPQAETFRVYEDHGYQISTI